MLLVFVGDGRIPQSWHVTQIDLVVKNSCSCAAAPVVGPGGIQIPVGRAILLVVIVSKGKVNRKFAGHRRKIRGEKGTTTRPPQKRRSGKELEKSSDVLVGHRLRGIFQLGQILLYPAVVDAEELVGARRHIDQ